MPNTPDAQAADRVTLNVSFDRQFMFLGFPVQIRLWNSPSIRWHWGIAIREDDGWGRFLCVWVGKFAWVWVLLGRDKKWCHRA